LALRRAEAVETSGIIRPLGIAEIGRTAREGVGSHRSPGGIGQVRAGFHHEDPIAGPSNVEPKPIRPHAKAGIAGFDHRLPKRGRTTAKRAAPACGSRQVIDSRVGGIEEYPIRKNKTGEAVVTPKIHSLQAGAGRKRREPNVAHGAEDRDGGQVDAVVEGIVPDAGDPAGDFNLGQAGAGTEQPPCDVRYAVGERNAGEAGAIRKRFAPNAGDTVGNRDAGQAGAAVERIVLDAGDTIGDRHVRQAGADCECVTPDAGDAGGDRDARQVGAGMERKGPNVGDAVGNRDAGQASA